MGGCAEHPSPQYLAALGAALASLWLLPEALDPLCSGGSGQAGFTTVVTPDRTLWSILVTVGAALPLLGCLLGYIPLLRLRGRWLMLGLYALPKAVVLAATALGPQTHTAARWFGSSVLPCSLRMWPATGIVTVCKALGWLTVSVGRMRQSHNLPTSARGWSLRSAVPYAAPHHHARGVCTWNEVK